MSYEWGMGMGESMSPVSTGITQDIHTTPALTPNSRLREALRAGKHNL